MTHRLHNNRNTQPPGIHAKILTVIWPKCWSVCKPAEKCSYRSTKKANMFKAKKKLIEKGSTSYLNQVLWSPQQTIPDHRLYLSIRSKNSSAEHIHTLPTCLILINTLTHIDKHTYSHTDSFTHTRARARAHTETCIKSVNMFGWGIFGAVWNGRDGDKTKERLE